MSYKNFINSINRIFSSYIHAILHKHISKNGHKHIHKGSHTLHHFFHRYLHLGELILVAIFSFASIIFASETVITNNDYFDYPLKQVSTLECRVLHWDEIPDDCKVDLPIIKGSNYSDYQDIKIYRDIYTVIWGAPYTESWNQKIGSHPGVDIATAKGTPLYAIGNGRVFYAGWQAGYGNVVKIEYKYQGETVYSIYGHMESLLVQNGDLVVRGQQVGTVGNSGSVTGALGGYHVHFELVKDNSGRPMYSYLGCKDLARGDYAITNAGLCRVELFDHTYDPIKIIESSLAIFAYNNKQNDTNTEGDSDDIVDNEPDHNSADTNTGVVEDEEDIPTSIGTGILPTGNNSGINLDYSTLDGLEKHFVSQRDISLETDFDGVLLLGNRGNVKVIINSKKHLGKFNGIVSPSLKFIGNNDVIDLGYKTLNLVQNGSADVSFKASSKGESIIVVYLGNYKIATINVDVK